MAAIDTYLQQILDAVYGEEVRGAIHDAIQQVYDDGRSGVPTSRKINGHDLTTDVTLTASDVGAVPTSRTVNGKALSSDVSLSASDVSALSNDRTITINGVSKNLSSNPSFTVEAEAGVPATRTINGHALSDDVTLTASDVGAVSLTGNSTMTGTLIWSNLTHGLKWTTEDGTQFFMRPYSPGNILQVTYIPVGETDQRPAITLNNDGVTSLGKPLRIVDGGTNATTAATALSNLGGVPTTRKITINGTAKTLDQDVSFTVEGGGGTGSVTSVRVQATSPVVSSVSTAQTASLDTTISLANNYGDTKNPYASKTANYVLAAPNGSAGAPSFRALVAADIPSLSASKITSGTMTGPISINETSASGGCHIKSTIVDLSSTTNGVSSIYQPGFNIKDKNGKNIAYFRGYVQSNGKTGYRIGATQYNTSGTATEQAIIGVDIAKDGTQTWVFPLSFRQSVLPQFVDGGTWANAYSKAKIMIKVVFGVNYSGNVHVLVIDIPKNLVISTGRFFFSSSCVHDGKQLFAQGMYSTSGAQYEYVFLGSDVQSSASVMYYYYI